MPATQTHLPTHAPTPASVPTTSTVAAPDDPIVADLRRQLVADTWHTDVALCVLVRSWMLSRTIGPSIAALTLGVPHVTADALARLVCFQRPLGTAADEWPELVAAYNPGDGVDASASATSSLTDRHPLDDLRRSIVAEMGGRGLHGKRVARTEKTARMIIDAAQSVCKRGDHEPLALGKLARALASDKRYDTVWNGRVMKYAGMIMRLRATTPQPRPQLQLPNTKDLVSELRTRIVAELGNRGTKQSTRSMDTARMIVNACAGLKPVRVSTNSPTGLPAAGTLARMLAEGDQDSGSVSRWSDRIAAYGPLCLAVQDKLTPTVPRPATSASAPALVVPAQRDTFVIVGRPVLLADGTLEVTTTTRIDHTHPAWPDAVKRINT